jgi:hypothetical protein
MFFSVSSNLHSKMSVAHYLQCIPAEQSQHSTYRANYFYRL